jgi:hypothetical protein
LGGAGSGWFASAGHVSHKTVDVLQVGRIDKEYAKIPNNYEIEHINGHYDKDAFESIGAYTNASGDYTTINKIMRGIDPSDEKYGHPDQIWVYRTHGLIPKDEAIMQAQKDIENLNRAMEKTPLKGDVKVYRGVPEYLANTLISGKTITDNAFQSTSLSLRPASKFSFVYSNNNNSKTIDVLEFVAKKGEPSIFSEDYGEKELILKGGQYKAISYTLATTLKDPDGEIPTYYKPTRIIQVERIPKTGQQTTFVKTDPGNPALDFAKQVESSKIAGATPA